ALVSDGQHVCFPSRRSSDLRASEAWARISPCAHGQAFMPWAVTLTSRRLVLGLAAAIPIRPYISWVAIPVTGVRYPGDVRPDRRSEEHTSELQSRENLVCRL